MNPVPLAVLSSLSDISSLCSSVESHGRSFELSLSGTASAAIKRATLSYCRTHPDVHVNVHAAGVRGASTIPPHNRLTHMTTFRCSVESECIRASVAYPINTRDRALATRVLHLGPVPDDRLGTVNNCMEVQGLACTLRRCDVGTSTPDSWVVEQTTGVYLLVPQGTLVF